MPMLLPGDWSMPRTSSGNSDRVDASPRSIHRYSARPCSARKSLVARKQNAHRDLRHRAGARPEGAGSPARRWHAVPAGRRRRSSSPLSSQGRLPHVLHLRRTRSHRPSALGSQARQSPSPRPVIFRSRVVRPTLRMSRPPSRFQRRAGSIRMLYEPATEHPTLQPSTGYWVSQAASSLHTGLGPMTTTQIGNQTNTE
jgi:hypothetical protein